MPDEADLSLTPLGAHRGRAPPTLSFADCWRRLPEELKLEILRNVLAFPRSLTLFDFKSGWVEEYLLPLLATPELRPIAEEAAYAYNTFRFDLRAARPLAYPNPSTTNFVRRIELVTGEREHGWKKAVSLLDGSLGFASLRNVLLDVCLHHPVDGTLANPVPVSDEISKWGIIRTAATDFTLRVHYHERPWQKRYWPDWLVNEIAEKLFFKIEFVDAAVQVKFKGETERKDDFTGRTRRIITAVYGK
jgi:hypothetical protein